MTPAPTRREFLASAAAILAAPRLAAPAIESIEPLGPFLMSCTLDGERRSDDVFPAHPNGLQVSRDRWLLIYSTRGFRGVDDDRSVVYQLRKGGPDGAVIKEGFLHRTRDDWDPYNQGKSYSRQSGHASAFGVPKGARRPNANVFVAGWYVKPRLVDRTKNYLEHSTADIGFAGPKHSVEQIQFRLNEREDDVEILRPAEIVKPRVDCAWMNQSFVPAVPFNREATEWADILGFDGGRVAAAKHVWNAKSGLYEWTQTGPFLGDADLGLFEGSLARHRDGWVVSARRSKGGIAWIRTVDPFATAPAPVLPAEPRTTAPITTFACPDGAIRMLSGDQGRRDPLFLWDVDPDAGFACTNRREILNSTGLKIRPASQAKIDMAKLLPPQGKTQLLLFRVSVRSFNHPYPNRPAIPVANDDEKAACGIYAAKITYAEAAAPSWEF